MQKRKIALAILAIVLVVAVLYFSYSESYVNKINNTVNSMGVWAPLALLLIVIITSSIGFIFTIPVIITARLLDAYSALFISVLGLTLGALISFLFVRYIGRDYVEKRFINKLKDLKKYNHDLEKKGFLTVFFLRLIMLMPYELINLAGGLSRVRTMPFIFGTVLGIIPGTLLVIYFVKSAGNLCSVQFISSVILLTIFCLLPLISKNLRKKMLNF